MAVVWNNQQAEPIQLRSCFTGVESPQDRRSDLEFAILNFDFE